MNVTVQRIPDPGSADTRRRPSYSQRVSASGGSITVPFTFQASHDAFAIYLTPAGAAARYPSGYHQLVVGNDNLCADVYGNSSSAGAAIDQWTCNGQTNQQFQFLPGSGGYGELQAENSGEFVTVASGSTAQGTPDIVQESASGAASAEWQPIQQSDGSYEFRNQNSGLCLDVYQAGSNLGQQFDQWPCKNAPGSNQDFTPR